MHAVGIAEFQIGSAESSAYIAVDPCRVCSRGATRCVLGTSSSKTSSMMSPMTLGTKPSSVVDTWTSSNFGSCGRQRWGSQALKRFCKRKDHHRTS